MKHLSVKQLFKELSKETFDVERVKVSVDIGGSLLPVTGIVLDTESKDCVLTTTKTGTQDFSRDEALEDFEGATP
jgi:hypothetical protein